MEGSVIKRKINILLLGIPLVLLRENLLSVSYVHGALNALFGEGADAAVQLIVFALAGLSLIPLAGFVESAVEELAELLGPFIGGLLHTTFGNVAELTIGLFLLLYGGSQGPELVLGSIAGVIIRNSLLFLGLSTVLGSLRNGKMKFDAENASEYSTVFALAVIGLSLPTIGSLVFADGASPEQRDHRLVLLSGALAIVLLISYLAYIFFAVFRFREGYDLVAVRQRKQQVRLQVKLQKRQERQERQQRHLGAAFVAQPDTQALFREEREQAERRLEGGGVAVAVAEREPQSEPLATPSGKRIYAKAGVLEHRRQAREERGEEGFLAGHPAWRGIVAAVVLAIATAGVASMSEAFAKQVEGLLGDNPQFKPYEFFLGLILIPVLAGIVEFYGSVETARNNRMEITMAVTAGASIQMILLVVPILVIVGYLTGHPLALVFQPLNIIIFGASTFIYMLLSRDGESTWLEGAQLCALWSLVAVVAFFLPPI